jgi:pimeloyl-ACP methyl ester carboxylesterase
MWNVVLPFFVDGGFPALSDDGSCKQDRTGYNILLHSQRGHGLSELPSQRPPSEGEEDQRRTTIPLLAADIHHLISTIIGRRAQSEDGQTHTPEVHIIGVSQGGAAALAYYALYGSSVTEGVKVKSIVACDTAPRTPPGNKEAWEDRISLALGSTVEAEGDVYARTIGMPKLAKVTLPRWFPPGSGLPLGGGSAFLKAREAWLGDMVSHTPVAGFVAGAGALGSYDIALPPSPLHAEAPVKESETDVTRVLLIAGSLDGGGKVGKGLKDFAKRWTEEGRQEVVEYVEVEGAGHLPMVDMPERFCKVLGAWLGVGKGGLGV